MAGTNPSYSRGKHSRLQSSRVHANCPGLNLGSVVASLVQQDAFIGQQSLIEHPAVAICLLPFLDVWDVLSLGSCSKSLREICESEETWKLLFMRRFDPLTLDEPPEYYEASAHAKAENLKKDMVARNVADKKVTLSWRLPPTEWNGIYMQEEKHTQVFSLKEIVETEMSFFHFLKYASECAELGGDQVTDVTVRFHQNDHL